MGSVDTDVDYLTKHNVHSALNSVLAQVLEECPANPISEMCGGLAGWGARNACFEEEGSLRPTLSALHGAMQCRRGYSTEERILLMQLQKECARALGDDAPGGHSAAHTGAASPSGEKGASKRGWLRPAPSAGGPSQHDVLYGQLIKSKDAADLLLKTCLEMTSSQTDKVDDLINVLMKGAANLLEADRCAFFLVEGSELVSKLAEGAGEIRVPIGVGLAGHVAQTGEIINIEDAYSDARFNQEVDKKTGYRTRSLLCAPVLYQDSVIAVAQLLNKRNGAFETTDLSLFKAFASFAGVCLANAYHYHEALYEKRKNEVILEVVSRVNQTDIRDWTSVAEVVRLGCIELIAAERCTLFTLDKEEGLLLAHTPSGEIRMDRSHGIAGHVCDTGETVNISDAYSDARFNPDIDAATGFVTRNMLCMPIRAGNEVLAVVQVINKEGAGDFTAEDEEILSFFSGFAGLHLSNAQLYTFCKESREQAMQLLTAQSDITMASPRANEINSGVNIEVATEEEVALAMELELTPEERQSVLTPEFNVHLYGPKTERNDALPALAVHLFDKLDLLKKFNISPTMLTRFLLTVKNKYRSVPYHNFTHAFDVTQTIYVFLTHGDARQFLTDVDTLALMVAALLHDVDHMGLNNSFHHKAETPLGLLSSASGATSVLEVHHCNVGIAILSVKECALFGSLGKDDNTEAYKSLINNILATDMARHGELLQSYTQACQEGFDKANPVHRRILTGILLKCADLSNLTKPFNISRLWGIAVTNEFFYQGDTEKAAGKQVTPGFDRENKQELAKGQCRFIDAVGTKFYSTVAEGVLKGLQYCYDSLLQNRAKWQGILEAFEGKKEENPKR